MRLFPPELIDAVFDNLEMPGDAATLSSCSQVCRLWLPLARRYLFSRLSSNPTTNDPYEASTEEVKWHEFLIPRYADLSVVTHLSLRSPPWLLTSSRLSLVLAELPRLQHLSLTRFSLDNFCQEAVAIPPFPALHSLKLSLLNTMSNLQSMVDLLSMFRHTHILRFHTIRVQVTWSRDPTHLELLKIPIEISPSTLVISPGWHLVLLDVFRRTRTVKTLTRLHLGHQYTAAHSIIANFLRSAQRLEILEVDVTRLRETDGEKMVEVYGSALAHLQSLHTFSLLCVTTDRGDILSDSYVVMVSLLPRNTRHLRVALLIEGVPLDLSLLKRRLQPLIHMPQLSILVQLVSSEFTDELLAAQNDLVDELPELVALGRLRVVSAQKMPKPLEFV